MDTAIILLVSLAMLAFFVVTVFAVVLALRPWLRAFLHGAPVSVIQIVGMRLRGNPPEILIDAFIALRRAGLVVTIADVENAYFDGKNRVSNSNDLVEIVKKRTNAR